MCIESNKHVGNVKPSHNAPFDVLTFDILTRVMVFEEVSRVEGRGQIGVFEKMLTG